MTFIKILTSFVAASVASVAVVSFTSPAEAISTGTISKTKKFRVSDNTADAGSPFSCNPGDIKSVVYSGHSSPKGFAKVQINTKTSGGDLAKNSKFKTTGRFYYSDKSSQSFSITNVSGESTVGGESYNPDYSVSGKKRILYFSGEKKVKKIVFFESSLSYYDCADKASGGTLKFK